MIKHTIMVHHCDDWEVAWTWHQGCQYKGYCCSPHPSPLPTSAWLTREYGIQTNTSYESCPIICSKK